MIQRRSHRTAPRTRSLALGGALAALAVVGGGTVVAVGAPTDVDAGDIRLAQNATAQEATAQEATAQDGAGQSAPPQEMPLGVAVDLDLEPVVARAAGGTIPPGTTVQVTGLPDGLTQDGWVISGTPTRAGEYEVLVTVSNSGVSQSQKVALTVTDGDTDTDGAATDGAATEGAATTDGATTTTDATDATPTSTPGADGAGADESGATARGDEATTSPSTTSPSTTSPATAAGDENTTAPSATSPATTAGDETDPTLSAVPGDPTQAGPSGEGAGDGVTTGDDDESTSPDMCAAPGEGQLDGASLAQLLPMVTGDDDAETSGLVMVILNTVVNLLPSVLGDSGSIGELGSAGEFLCTIPPSLLGGGSGEGGVGTGDTDTVTEGTGTDATGPGGAPSALLGMLTNGAGSTGQ